MPVYMTVGRRPINLLLLLACCWPGRCPLAYVLRRCYFSIFQDGGRRHFGFLKFGTFNGPTAQERRTASPCKISLKLLKTRPIYGDFSIFPRWRPSAILDLLCACLDHPRRAFSGLYRCAKFGWNRCNSFDNMHVFRFSQFAWETPIQFTPPKLFFLGDLTP